MSYEYVLVRIAPAYKFFWEQEAEKRGETLSDIIMCVMNDYFGVKEGEECLTNLG